MFSDPKTNVSQLDIQSGSRVADFGAGSGFYTLNVARAVGDRGRVYAVDVQRDILGRIKKEALERGLHNVEIIGGDLEMPNGSHLKDALVDWVIISNLLFQVSAKENVLKEANRILKVNGRMCIVDWTDSFGGMGPEAKKVVSEKMARELAGESGFVFERRIIAGEHHYGLVFKKLNS